MNKVSTIETPINKVAKPYIKVANFFCCFDFTKKIHIKRLFTSKFLSEHAPHFFPELPSPFASFSCAKIFAQFNFSRNQLANHSAKHPPGHDRDEMFPCMKVNTPAKSFRSSNSHAIHCHWTLPVLNSSQIPLNTSKSSV